MFTIMLWDAENLLTEIATIDGCEAAYIAYEQACKFAELVGKNCILMDTETGEIIATLESEE